MSASEGKVVIAQGRIVWGVSQDLFKGAVQTEFNTNTPKVDPKTGEKVIRYGFGLAIQKSALANPNDPSYQLWAAMHSEALTLYPSGQIPPSFAMKYKDGDSVDDQGVPYSQREGHAGCLIFALTTNLPIRFFRWEGGQNVQVADGIKVGDYVDVQIMVKAHAAQGQGKAGLYLNPMMVRLAAPGKEIINKPSGDQVFGLGAPQAPAGYVPPAAGAMPGAPPPPMGSYPPPAAPAAPAAMPPAAPQPHYGVLPHQHQPASAPPPMAPPPAAYAPPQPAYAPAPAPQAPGMPPIPGVPR